MSNQYELLLAKRLHEEAVAIEKVHFTKTDRSVDPRKESPFLYLLGSKPLLISVPRAVRYRKGKKICVSDEFTGSIGYLLHQLSGAHVLACSKLYNGDPGSDKPCIYKHQIAEICSKNKIRLVIDILGAPRDSEVNLDISYTSGGWEKSKLVPQKLIYNLNDQYLEKVIIHDSSFDKEYCVTKFVGEEMQLPALQIRINRKFRAPNRSGPAFCRMMAALLQLIDQTAKENL